MSRNLAFTIAEIFGPRRSVGWKRLLARLGGLQAVQIAQTTYFCAMLQIVADQHPKDVPRRYPCAPGRLCRLLQGCVAGLGERRCEQVVSLFKPAYCFGSRIGDNKLRQGQLAWAE